MGRETWGEFFVSVGDAHVLELVIAARQRSGDGIGMIEMPITFHWGIKRD